MSGETTVKFCPYSWGNFQFDFQNKIILVLRTVKRCRHNRPKVNYSRKSIATPTTVIIAPMMLLMLVFCL